MRNFQANRRETHKQGMHFLRSELETALTLAELARTAKGKDKRQRNVANARRAYDELIRFRGRATLTPAESEELNASMAALQKNLEELGEKF